MKQYALSPLEESLCQGLHHHRHHPHCDDHDEGDDDVEDDGDDNEQGLYITYMYVYGEKAAEAKQH